MNEQNNINKALQDINKELENAPVIIKNKIIENIPIDQIILTTEREDLGDLDLLKASIKKYGLINPVTLLRIEDKKYKKIAGYRRIIALKELGETTVPAIVIESNEIKEVKTHLLTFYENVARKNINIIEKINLFMLALYDLVDKDFFSNNKKIIIKTKEKIKEKFPEFDTLNEDAQKILTAKKMFNVFYNLERKKESNLNSTEAQILEKWITFKKEFGFSSIETIKKYIKISTLPNFYINLLQSNIINKEYALKILQIIPYENTYKKMTLRIENHYNDFKNNIIDIEEITNLTKEIIDYYCERKEFEEINDNKELIEKNKEFTSYLKMFQKKVNKQIKNSLIPENKIEKIIEMFRQIENLVEEKEEQDDN